MGIGAGGTYSHVAFPYRHHLSVPARDPRGLPQPPQTDPALGKRTPRGAGSLVRLALRFPSRSPGRPTTDGAGWPWRPALGIAAPHLPYRSARGACQARVFQGGGGISRRALGTLPSLSEHLESLVAASVLGAEIRCHRRWPPPHCDPNPQPWCCQWPTGRGGGGISLF